jgi:hypothetical protein
VSIYQMVEQKKKLEWKRKYEDAKPADREARRQILEARRIDQPMGADYMGDGGGPSQDLQAALGHWAENDYGTQRDRPSDEAFEQVYSDRPDGSQQSHRGDPYGFDRVAAHHIHDHYMVESKADFDKLAELGVPPEDAPIDLSSPDARLLALDNLSQETPGNISSKDQCVAASLVGAAMLSGGETGTEGLLALMDGMERNGHDSGSEARLEQLKVMREKIASGVPMTIGDMHGLQDALYDQLKATQNLENERTGKKVDPDHPDPGGINAAVVADFLGASPELAERMRANKLALSYVENNGEQPFLHAVLEIGRGEGQPNAYYDPLLRDEGQVITDAREAEDYHRAQRVHLSA